MKMRRQRKIAQYKGDYDKVTLKVVMLMERLFRCPRCIKQARHHGHTLSQCGHITLLNKRRNEPQRPKPFLCKVCRKYYTGDRVWRLITRRLNRGLPSLLALLLLGAQRDSYE